MKNIVLIIFLSTSSLIAFSQVKESVGGILSQEYSKEITEYKVKEFIVRDILELPDNKIVELEIDAITAASSGEITTVIYRCKELNKSGIVFGFYNPYINEFNVKFNAYKFKNFDFEDAVTLLNKLDNVMDEKKSIIKLSNNDGYTKNAVYKHGDLIFIFYKGGIGANLIRVLWNDFDSEWNQMNLKATHRRFNQFFDIKKD